MILATNTVRYEDERWLVAAHVMMSQKSLMKTGIWTPYMTLVVSPPEVTLLFSPTSSYVAYPSLFVRILKTPVLLTVTSVSSALAMMRLRTFQTDNYVHSSKYMTRSRKEHI